MTLQYTETPAVHCRGQSAVDTLCFLSLVPDYSWQEYTITEEAVQPLRRSCRTANTAGSLATKITHAFALHSFAIITCRLETTCEPLGTSFSLH